MKKKKNFVVWPLSFERKTLDSQGGAPSLHISEYTPEEAALSWFKEMDLLPSASRFCVAEATGDFVCTVKVAAKFDAVVE